jgi:excisionase family DNA binding protein
MATNLEQLPPTITVTHAAKLLGIGKNQAYKAAASGELPVVRIGHRLLVPTARVLMMLGVQVSEPPSRVKSAAKRRIRSRVGRRPRPAFLRAGRGSVAATERGRG